MRHNQTNNAEYPKGFIWIYCILNAVIYSACYVVIYQTILSKFPRNNAKELMTLYIFTLAFMIILHFLLWLIIGKRFGIAIRLNGREVVKFLVSTCIYSFLSLIGYMEFFYTNYPILAGITNDSLVGDIFTMDLIKWILLIKLGVFALTEGLIDKVLMGV